MDMSFEIQVLLQRIVMTSLVGLIGGFVLSRCERRVAGTGDGPLRGVGAASFFGALLVGAGLIASDLWQRGMIAEPWTWRRWDAREPWMWMVWLVPSLILFLGIAKGLLARPNRFATWCLPWVVAGAAGILYVALPQSSGYQDKLPDAIRWLAIGIAAVSLNSASLNAISSRPGGRWGPSVLFAQLVCIAGLTLQSYASLGEFVLAALGLSLGLALVSLFVPSGQTFDYGWPLAPAVMGLMVLAAAGLVVSTFYVSDPPPTWLVAGILFLPSLIAGIDLCLAGKHWGWRLFAAVLLWAMVLAVVIFKAMQSKSDW